MGSLQSKMKSTYSPVRDSDEARISHEPTKEEAPFLDSPGEPRDLSEFSNAATKKRSWLRQLIVVAATALLSSGLTAWLAWMQADHRCEHMKGRSLLDNYLPPDSPLLEIDRSVSTKIFRPWNFTPSVWNEHPSLDRVDDLWVDKLGVHNHFFMIPIDKGADYALDPRVHVTLKDMPGDVPHGFPVNIEVIHQLHCLDALRRKLFMNRDWYKENWEVFAQWGMEQAHTSHCLDMIRQVITCRSDVGVLGWKWVKVNGNSLPDFQRPHQCHNFEAARDWSAAHQMPQNIQKYEDHQAPPADALWADKELFHGDLKHFMEMDPSEKQLEEFVNNGAGSHDHDH